MEAYYSMKKIIYLLFITYTSLSIIRFQLWIPCILEISSPESHILNVVGLWAIFNFFFFLGAFSKNSIFNKCHIHNMKYFD